MSLPEPIELKQNAAEGESLLQRAQQDLTDCQTELKKFHWRQWRCDAMVESFRAAVEAVSEFGASDELLYAKYTAIHTQVQSWYFEYKFKAIFSSTVNALNAKRLTRQSRVQPAAVPASVPSSPGTVSKVAPTSQSSPGNGDQDWAPASPPQTRGTLTKIAQFEGIIVKKDVLLSKAKTCLNQAQTKNRTLQADLDKANSRCKALEAENKRLRGGSEQRQSSSDAKLAPTLPPKPESKALPASQKKPLYADEAASFSSSSYSRA